MITHESTAIAAELDIAVAPVIAARTARQLPVGAPRGGRLGTSGVRAAAIANARSFARMDGRDVAVAAYGCGLRRPAAIFLA